uniref:Uncharacterized protein n=1 Tax=Ditylenchus dipsaci TaxID=166011 RepID=A0A915CTQ1_9BILA
MMKEVKGVKLAANKSLIDRHLRLAILAQPPLASAKRRSNSLRKRNNHSVWPTLELFLLRLEMVFLVCHVLLFASILMNLAGYQPGHLPLFIDPAEKASDTFYDLKTNLAFPPKDNVSFNSKEGWQALNNAGTYNHRQCTW